MNHNNALLSITLILIINSQIQDWWVPDASIGTNFVSPIFSTILDPWSTPIYSTTSIIGNTRWLADHWFVYWSHDVSIKTPWKQARNRIVVISHWISNLLQKKKKHNSGQLILQFGIKYTCAADYQRLWEKNLCDTVAQHPVCGHAVIPQHVYYSLHSVVWIHTGFAGITRCATRSIRGCLTCWDLDTCQTITGCRT